MKIVVEALCAEFGGIRTYVEHLLAQWSDVFPEDELHVLVGKGAALPTGDHIRHEVPIRRPAMIGRPLAQTRAVRRIVSEIGADAVLATLPSTTLRRPGRPMAVVVYDLRHELRPEHFTLSRRIIRNVSYGRGYRLADGIIAISQRTLDDLYRQHSWMTRIPSTVAYLGADHVETWPSSERVGPSVTFAHHNNKNIDLVLDGWEALVRREAPTPPLLVLGVPAANRDTMAADLRDRGIDSAVHLAEFLPESQFHQVMADAEMVIFPTDFEGFGLPVVEGMRLGKPVVIGPEKATMEVADGHAFVLTDWTAEALAVAVTAARESSVADRKAAQAHAETFTWERTIRATRAMLAGLTT